jgi:hypothetical protein
MALDRERNFVDFAEEADASRAARRVALVGTLIVLALGFGLVALLMYGRVLTDDGVVALSAPAAVTVPQAPSQVAPPPKTF